MSRGHLGNGSKDRILDSICGSGSHQSTLKRGTRECHPEASRVRTTPGTDGRNILMKGQAEKESLGNAEKEKQGDTKEGESSSRGERGPMRQRWRNAG